MRPNKYYVYFSLLFFFVLAYCGDESITYEDPLLLNLEDFTFVPESPKANKDVNLVFYGCEYYTTKSLIKTDLEIEIIKNFNSAMKPPCILKYDTISLGKLKKGTYNVSLRIIDINSFTKDSLFYSESKTLIVGK